jgi:hypothetical protein
MCLVLFEKDRSFCHVFQKSWVLPTFIFYCKSVGRCTDLFYDVIWSCFGSFVLKTSPHCVQKFPRVTKKLNGLKNRPTRAAKKIKLNERRYMLDDDIDDCECNRLRDDITALKTEYQEHHWRARDDYRIGIEKAITIKHKCVIHRS